MLGSAAALVAVIVGTRGVRDTRLTSEGGILSMRLSLGSDCDHGIEA
jgi:hypothetical protein